MKTFYFITGILLIVYGVLNLFGLVSFSRMDQICFALFLIVAGLGDVANLRKK